MRIMTSNIWGDYFNNPTVGRDEHLYGIYQKYNPDVLGFQEVTKGWYNSSLFESLRRDYYFVGIERFAANNFVPLAIKKDFSLLAKGFEYLENTPDVSKAITWAVVRRNGVVMAFCNTHFWWMRGSESEGLRASVGVLEYSLEDHCRLRAQNAEQLTRLMKQIHARYSCPVFAFGDMNSVISEGVFEVYEQNGVKRLIDLTAQRDTVCTIHGDPVKGADGAYHGRTATKEYVAALYRYFGVSEKTDGADSDVSIDHIVALGDSFKVLQYRVVEDQDALDATDHTPVYADIEFVS